jgi:hypothetical protein
MDFKIFVGIDQTGSTHSNGRPKSLPVSIIDFSSGTQKNFSGLKIKHLTHTEIVRVIEVVLPRFNQQKVLICVDSVFGLPQTTQTPIRQIFSKIKGYSFNGKPYGALAAHSFFSQFLRGGQTQHRTVEKKVGANSVFRLKPYQRNIGCGSFRIIKDLSEGPQWFSLWPFDRPRQQFTIAEGYPTFFWDNLFQTRKRSISLLESRFKNLHFKTVDEADSFVLALGAAKFKNQIVIPKIPKIAKKEGWILGVPFEIDQHYNSTDHPPE